MFSPKKQSGPDEQKAQALRVLDAARKRCERAARRHAKLTEIRLTATMEQRARLFEILEREQLTLLRYPRQVLASVNQVPPIPGSARNIPAADASKAKRSGKKSKRAGVQPIEQAQQLDFFA